MKVRLLSPYGLNLAKTIETAGDEILHPSDEGYADLCVMYGHRDILTQEEIDRYRAVINIHPSMLPYGRGAHPNFWAWFDDEPHGVTIHYVTDRGLDNGPIIATAAVEFAIPNNETLNSSYMTLHEAAERLFDARWTDIRDGAVQSYPQLGKGSYHNKSDIEPFWSLLPKKWDTPVTVVQELGRKHRGGSGYVDDMGSLRISGGSSA